MSATLDISVPEPVVVHFKPSKLRMNDEEFFEFCQLNPELRIERTSGGDIIVKTPTGGKTGRRNARLIAALGIWAEKDGSNKRNFHPYVRTSSWNLDRPQISWKP